MLGDALGFRLEPVLGALTAGPDRAGAVIPAASLRGGSGAGHLDDIDCIAIDD